MELIKSNIHMSKILKNEAENFLCKPRREGYRGISGSRNHY